MRRTVAIYLTRLSYSLLSAIIILSILILSISSSTLASHWLLNTLINNSSISNQVSIQGLDGSLLHGLTLHQLSYRQNAFTITIDALALNWQPLGLFSGKLIFNSIAASNVEFQFKSAPAPISNAPSEIPIETNTLWSLPITIELKQILLRKLTLKLDETTHNIEKIDAQVKLDSERITIQKLYLAHSALQISLQGSLENTTAQTIKANAQWHYLANNQTVMAGQLNLSGNTKKINLQHQLQTPFEIITRGEINLHGKPNATLDSAINNAQWQVKKNQSITYIKHAVIKLSGWIDNINLNIKSNLSYAEITDAHLILEAQGNPDAFNISKFSLQSSEKKFSGIGSAEITLKPQLSLKTNIDLSLAGNQLNLQGQLDDKINLNWTLHAQTLQHFWPELNGSLTSKGHISGTRTQPIINGHFKGNQLQYRDYAIGQITLSAQSSARSNNIILQANDLSVSQQHIDGLDATLTGNLDQHQVAATLTHHLGQFSINLIGQYQQSSWLAQLNHGTLSNPTFGTWTLAQPSKILWSTEQISIEHHCWRQQTAELCSKAKLTAANQIELESKLIKLPLTIFKPYISDLHTIEGYANADLTLNGPIDRFISHIQVISVDGALLITDEEEDGATVYPWKNAILNIEGHYGHRWQIRGSADLLHNGQLNGDIDIDAQQNLSGHISANMKSIALLDTFVPQLSHSDGQLEARADLTGTVKQPLTQLSINLSNAHTNITPLGLNLKNISLQANSSKPQHINLVGRADSGQGQIHVEGVLIGNIINDWQLQLQTKGNNVEFINLSQIKANANPDLKWTISRKQLDVQGNLHITKGIIDIKTLPANAIDISPDAVLINAQHPVNDYPYIITNQINITLSDDVHFQGLGFNSLLSGQLNIQEKADQPTQAYGELLPHKGFYKAYGQTLAIEDGSKLIFQGPYNNPNLRIRSIRRNEEMTVGIEISGTLKKPQSRLFSTPSLPETEIVAVLLTGKPLSSASKADANMLINAVATLGIERGDNIRKRISDTLKLDVLSIDTQDDFKQSSLLLGKYLTPRLYVRYTIGLFDQSNNLGLEYQLNKKLKLEAQSGTLQSIDLIYKVER